MSDLRELYQEIIIDHGRHPRNFGAMENATASQEGFNPLCGDKIFLHILEKNGVVVEIRFEGSGCAISMASASLLTEFLKGKTRAEVETIFQAFHALVTQGETHAEQQLGKLAVFRGVCEFPARVKCATLVWHTLRAALAGDSHPVSSEQD